jgi:hypothetical protein
LFDALYSSINSSYFQYLKYTHTHARTFQYSKLRRCSWKSHIYYFSLLLLDCLYRVFWWKLNKNEIRYVKISIIINISGNITCCQPGCLSIVVELCTEQTLSYVPLNVDHLLAFLLTWEHLNNRSWDRSVSIVARLRDGRSGVRITIGAKRFSLLQEPPDRKLGPPPLGALSRG